MQCAYSPTGTVAFHRFPEGGIDGGAPAAQGNAGGAGGNFGNEGGDDDLYD